MPPLIGTPTHTYLTAEQWNEIEGFLSSLSPLTKTQLRIEVISSIPNHNEFLGTDKSKWCYFDLLANWWIATRFGKIINTNDSWRIQELKWASCSTMKHNVSIRPILPYTDSVDELHTSEIFMPLSYSP